MTVDPDKLRHVIAGAVETLLYHMVCPLGECDVTLGAAWREAVAEVAGDEAAMPEGPSGTELTLDGDSLVWRRPDGHTILVTVASWATPQVTEVREAQRC